MLNSPRQHRILPSRRTFDPDPCVQTMSRTVSSVMLLETGHNIAGTAGVSLREATSSTKLASMLLAG